MKNREITRALHSVHKKMMEGGLFTAKDFKHIFAIALLLLSFATLYAQETTQVEELQVKLEGEQFTVDELIRGVAAQGVSIRNVSRFVDRNEVIRQTASWYFVRDVVDQTLAGSGCEFHNSSNFTVLVVQDAAGVVDRIFVESATNRIVSVNEMLGDETLSTTEGVINETAANRLSGGQYTLHSTETYTVITMMCREGVRRVVVDGTGQVVPLEHFTGQQNVRQPDAHPRFVIKTNLLYGATATINLGVEFWLNDRWTLDIAGGWNPFVFRNDRKFAHWSIQPTARYWFNRSFDGHFIGGSLMYSNFNISGIELPFNIYPRWADQRFRGDAYSISAQYGHQWRLSPRWGIETSINIGYMFLDFQRFEAGRCGKQLGSQTRHHFGITNAAISIIYTLR